MADRTLCEVDSKVCLENYYSRFYHPFSERVRQHFPLARQTFLVPHQINTFMDLRKQYHHSSLKELCWNLINNWRFIPFQLPDNNPNFRATRFFHKWLAFHSTEQYPPHEHSIANKVIPSSFQNFIKIRKQVTLFIHYHVCSRLTTLLKFIYATIRVSLVLFCLI